MKDVGTKQDQVGGARKEDALLSFGLSQWQRVDVVKRSYLVYRCLTFITLLSVGVYQTTYYVIAFNEIFILFLSISMETYLAALLDAGVQLATSIMLTKVFKPDGTALSSGSSEITGRYETVYLPASFASLCKVQLIVVNISRTMAPLVTAAYLLGALVEHDMDYADFSTVHYILPAVYTTVDLLVNRMSFQFRHIIFPLCYLLIYTAFTWVYYILDGENMFGSTALNSLIDWRHYVQSSAVVLATLAWSVIVHAVNLLLLRMRQQVFTWKYRCSENEYTLLPIHNV